MAYWLGILEVLERVIVEMFFPANPEYPEYPAILSAEDGNALHLLSALSFKL